MAVFWCFTLGSPKLCQSSVVNCSQRGHGRLCSFVESKEDSMTNKGFLQQTMTVNLYIIKHISVVFILSRISLEMLSDKSTGSEKFGDLFSISRSCAQTHRPCLKIKVHVTTKLTGESLNFQVLFFAHCYPEKLGVVIYTCNPSTQEENHHQFQNSQSCIVKNQQKLERQIPLRLSLHPIYSVSLKS